MFVLAMKLDETIRKILERGRCRERAVDERAAPALRCDLAPDDQLATVVGFEDGLDGRVIFAGAAGARRALRHDAVERVRHGTTAFLVTTVSTPRRELRDLVAALAQCLEGPGPGARRLRDHAGALGAEAVRRRLSILRDGLHGLVGAALVAARS